MPGVQLKDLAVLKACRSLVQERGSLALAVHVHVFAVALKAVLLPYQTNAALGIQVRLGMHGCRGGFVGRSEPVWRLKYRRSAVGVRSRQLRQSDPVTDKCVNAGHRKSFRLPEIQMAFF